METQIIVFIMIIVFLLIILIGLIRVIGNIIAIGKITDEKEKKKKEKRTLIEALICIGMIVFLPVILVIIAIFMSMIAMNSTPII